MKKKLFISLSVLLVSGTAFMANYVFAEDTILDTDPNVEALRTVKAETRCYVQDDNYSCKKVSNKSMCAACDDEIVVTPEKK